MGVIQGVLVIRASPGTESSTDGRTETVHHEDSLHPEKPTESRAAGEWGTLRKINCVSAVQDTCSVVRSNRIRTERTYWIQMCGYTCLVTLLYDYENRN